VEISDLLSAVVCQGQVGSKGFCR